jgi:CheY-like chemotaxis protein
MSDIQTLTAARTPTVYFIDDSATMREVIKIAFRKENIHVITCADAASAMAQFGANAPDAVITDVIMPDKDGYEVCQFIKDNEVLAKTPVILMSGVVNKQVAEKAMAVKADELVRKPFQPADLIARVKSLLNPKSATSAASRDDGRSSSDEASRILGGLFGPAPNAFQTPVSPSVSAPPVFRQEPFGGVPAARPAATSIPAQFQSAQLPRPGAATSADIQKLKNEIRRLELFVKKLQGELESQRQYAAALEAHFRAMQDAE